MLDFHLIHKRNKSLGFKKYFLNSKALFWETCLRQVVFSEKKFNRLYEVQSFGDDLEFFEGKGAYQFLLEVISGLHSPILGETEVLGQFKILVQQNKGSAFDVLWQRLLADAKKVRSTYLNGIRQQSYGSLVRQVAKPYSTVEIIGAGFLVKKILPWLKKDKEIFIFCRDPKRGFFLKKKFSDLVIKIKDFPYQDREPDLVEKSLLIVAAPLSLESLKPWVKKKKSGLILDLRAQSNREKRDLKKISSVSLKTLNEMLEEGRLQFKISEHKVRQAFQMIRDQSNLFFQSERVFPFGWEDLSF